MKHVLLRSESTLTDRYQTTIPEPIREAMHLGKRDKITYALQSDGKVLMYRSNEEDPVLGNFLSFLAEDIQDKPSRLRVLNPALLKRVRALVSDLEVDLDAPLSDKDD